MYTQVGPKSVSSSPSNPLQISLRPSPPLEDDVDLTSPLSPPQPSRRRVPRVLMQESDDWVKEAASMSSTPSCAFQCAVLKEVFFSMF